MLEWCPRIVVDQSTFVTSINICGRNHILRFWVRTIVLIKSVGNAPMVGSVILPNGDFIVCCGRIIRPCFFWHHLFRNGLPKLKENIRRKYKGFPTSKSWRFNISSRGGLFEKRSNRAFSSSVILTSTFSTVSGSTGPKLCKIMRSKTSHYNERSALLFFWWKVCSDSVWWMNGIIFLPGWECLLALCGSRESKFARVTLHLSRHTSV